MDDLFTLALVDGNTGKLHWLLVDISASELGTEGEKGITVSREEEEPCFSKGG